ncbi:MAG: DUF3466 family protein [Armatimonadota bacterium]
MKAAKIVLVIICMQCVVVTVADALTYTVQAFDNFQPCDINNKGQVAGRVFESGAWRGAALWEAGTFTSIEVLSGYDSTIVTEINDNGQVVGYCHSTSGTYSDTAFLWQKDTGMINLGILPGAQSSTATAINNQGQIVGYVNSGKNRLPFIWESGTGMTGLPLLLGCTYGTAADINDSGHIVGACFNPLEDLWGDALSHPFVWDDADGTRAYGPSAYIPVKINNLDQVVGAIPGVYWCEPIILHPDGTQVAMHVSPIDMNNLGEIIGEGDGDIWVYGCGLFRSCDGTVDYINFADSGEIVAINDHNQVVSTNALITITPEPSSAIAVIGGVAGLGAAAFRRKKVGSLSK